MANSAFTPTFNVSAGSVGEPQLAAGATLKLGTQQASTSGTAIDFTGIPAGTKQIIVMLEGVSTNGAGRLYIQIGDSGGIEATGYLGNVVYLGDATNSLSQNYAGAAFELQLTGGMASTTPVHYQIQLTLKDAANFTWVSSGVGGFDAVVTACHVHSGSKSLSAELTQIRITTASADTFDAGSINIAYK